MNCFIEDVIFFKYMVLDVISIWMASQILIKSFFWDIIFIIICIIWDVKIGSLIQPRKKAMIIRHLNSVKIFITRSEGTPQQVLYFLLWKYKYRFFFETASHDYVLTHFPRIP